MCRHRIHFPLTHPRYASGADCPGRGPGVWLHALVGSLCWTKGGDGGTEGGTIRAAVNRGPPLTPHARFLAIADRLRRLTAGSAEADSYIHRALGRAGPVLPYTSNEAAALALLPPDFEADWPTTGGGEVYAAVWRRGLLDGLPYPHHGQWGATRALALCGAAMRAHALLAKPPT
jgi:hypothetical protein